jgi:Domain of unknown function (DUF4157)
LKGAVESLSGLSMDDVRVHYNSSKPAQVQALAYAQGTEVHLGPNQEQHLAHEAWHVVQQKQGRATADVHYKDRLIASDSSLEREADVMGATANKLVSDLRTHEAANPVGPAAGLPSRPVRRSGPSVVLQAKWKDIDRIDPWNLTRADPENALGELAGVMSSPLLLQYQGLTEFFAIGGSEIVGAVREYLKTTMKDGQSHLTDDLLKYVIDAVTTTMRPPMQAVYGGTDDENDHPEEDAPAVEEEVITDPSHVDTKALRNEPGLLEIIFRNIAKAQGYVDVTREAFLAWYGAGVVTRGQFKRILEEHRSPVASGDPMVIQMKRLANTASGPSSYTTSNYGPFVNVTYTTDASANIDFSVPTSQGTWTNPVMPGTVVRLQTGSTRKGYGILNNGVETKLFRAGRSRHNMIATRLRPDLVAAATPTHTRHHRTTEYEMELVDYMVHRKHGHNGGFLFWRDNQ